MSHSLQYDQPGGGAAEISLREPPDLRLTGGIAPVRLAYAAAHLVTLPPGQRDRSADLRDQIDWDRTLAFRRHLWSLGMGVAEAMDTAQRFTIGWDVASELIDRTLTAARETDAAGGWGEVMVGAGADGLKGFAGGRAPILSELIDEFIRQGRFIQERGGSVILLATPHLPRMKAGADDYVELYTQVARGLEGPIFVHWLGEMFASELAGYFPGDSFDRIMDGNADRIRGVKLSLLDQDFEIGVRNRLRERGQVVLTGDDYNYPDLIGGDGDERENRGGEPWLEVRGRKFPTGPFSHGLLGIFDAIAPVAAKALELLSAGDAAGYRRLMKPTEALARVIFEPPTEHYKAGVVFLAWLNGHQDHFDLIADVHLERSREHYIQVFELANECGALTDTALAAERFAEFVR